MPEQVDYQQVLAKINSLVEEASDELDHARAAALRTEMLRLQEWLQRGQQGDCRIDISKYGFDASIPASSKTEERRQELVVPEPLPLATEEQEQLALLSPEPLPLATEEQEQLALLSPEPLPLAAEKQEQPALLSPEERTILEQLKQVRIHLENGQLREAVALARMVEARATGNVKREAEQLLNEARQKSDFALRTELDKGDAALERGDQSAARQHYEAALGIDPENAHAKGALRRLRSSVSASGTLTIEEINALRAGLKDRKNLKRLGEAVYEAEALDAEGTLPPELTEVLREARDAYDALRVAHGEETTMMRFGDLNARKTARDQIANRVAQSEKFIYDATTNTERAAYELLQEADQLLKERSADTAQYEMDVINLLLPARPIGAKKRLEEALSKPFHEEQKRELEKRLIEIEGLVEKQQEAEKYLSEAAAEEDKIKILTLLLKARDTFPYRPTIESEVAQAGLEALRTLMHNLEDAYRNARSLVQMRDSASAEAVVAEALKQAAAWPMKEIPNQLQELIQEGERFQEFIAAANIIRREIADPHQRGAALEKFERLRTDARFTDTPEMRSFLLEMDRYRDFDDQLKEAEEAKSRGDWQRVYDLTDHVRKSGKAGEFGPQVDALFETAEQELRIEEARLLLDNGEVKKANNIISTMLATEKDAERRQELEKRLKKENEIIDQAIVDSPPMQELYNRALSLQGGSLQERLEALRIFRHVGGIPSEASPTNWATYRLSLRTADARKCASDLAEAIRHQCLETLREAFEKSDNGHILNNEMLRRLSPYASVLREGHLIYSDEERSLVRWVEVAWGKQQAQAKEEEGNWKSAVEIWRRLSLHHPELPDVESGLRRARIQQVVIEANRILNNEHDEAKAIQWLEAAQQEGLETSWEVLLTLANAHARRSEFDKAFGILAEAERYNADKTTLKQQRANIEREQIIQGALQAVKAKLALGSPREALLTLRDALSNPLARASRRLKERREAVFLAAQETLLAVARQAHETAMPDNMLRAVTALVDLRELEELAEQPKSRRRSEEELRHLSAELPNVAAVLIAKSIDFQSRDLDTAIREADLLLTRLQTFLSVMPLFMRELGEMKEQLESRRRQVARLLQNLQILKSRLDDANKPALWERALLYNVFYEIEAKWKTIQEMDLNDNPDVAQFGQRLLEWKTIHAYIIEQIKQLERLFDVEENFDDAISLLRRLPTRPALREWKSLQQKEYEEILQLMEPQFRLVNIYGDGQPLVGRAVIETECQQRLHHLNLWTEWDRNVARKMDEAAKAMQVVESYQVGSEQVPLLHQQRDWQNALEKAQMVLAAIQMLPCDEKGSALPAFSKGATAIQKEGERRKKIAEEWAIAAQHALSDLDRMLKDLIPTEDDFKEAVAQRDWLRLERLLKQAKRAGALDEIGQRRINVYEQVLQKARQPNESKKSWRDRFKLG